MIQHRAIDSNANVREWVGTKLARIPSTARRRLVIFHDLLAAYLSFLVAVFLRDSSLAFPPGLRTAHTLIPLFLLLFALLARRYRLDQGLWRFASQSDLLSIAKVTAFAVGVFYLGLFLVHRLDDVPRSLPVIHGLVLIFLLASTRIGYAAWLLPTRTARAGIHLPDWEPTLLVGAGQGAAILIDLFHPGGRALSSLEFVGIIDGRSHFRDRAIGGVPVLGGILDIEQVIAQLSIHGMRPRRLVLAAEPEQLGPEGLQTLYTAAERQGLTVHEAVDLLRRPNASFGTSSFLVRETVPAADLIQGWSWATKRLIDIIVSASLLLAAAPGLLATAVLIRMFLGNPVIFHQIRPGRHLRAFTLYKFRTLKDGHQPDGTILADEDRQTWLGSFLRRTRLDELPQLWNVLIGDMTLIGPRPLLPRDLPELDGTVHKRFLVRPGITGWAQVNGGHPLAPHEKLALDLWYIRNFSLRLDLAIVGKTVRMMAFGEARDQEAIDRAFG